MDRLRADIPRAARVVGSYLRSPLYSIGRKMRRLWSFYHSFHGTDDLGDYQSFFQGFRYLNSGDRPAPAGPQTSIEAPAGFRGISENYAVKNADLHPLVMDLGAMLQNPSASDEQALRGIADELAANAVSVYERRACVRTRQGGKVYFAYTRPGESIIVSTGFLRPFMVYFDYWLHSSDPQDRIDLVNRFESGIRDIANRENRPRQKPVDYICMIDKCKGPEGARAIKHDILERFPSAAWIDYRQETSESTFSKPVQPGDTFVILYDLGETRSGTIHARKNLEKEQPLTFLGAVYLYDSFTFIRPPGVAWTDYADMERQSHIIFGDKDTRLLISSRAEELYTQYFRKNEIGLLQQILQTAAGTICSLYNLGNPDTKRTVTRYFDRNRRKKIYTGT